MMALTQYDLLQWADGVSMLRDGHVDLTSRKLLPKHLTSQLPEIPLLRRANQTMAKGVARTTKNFFHAEQI